jgi:beta-1,4-mannosyltransferase
MRATYVRGERSTRRSISSLSVAGLNPYLDLLYESLAAAGVPRGPPARLRLRWLVRHRKDVRYLHVHWPESLYRFQRGPSRLGPCLSWIKFAVFAARLRVAHVLGYRLIWTIHQVYPHGMETRLDRAGGRMLARHCNLLLAHDPETAARARNELGSSADAVEIVPHGSYAGVYPPGRSRVEVRRALGIRDDAIVFLCFGELRANSQVTVLLDAFAQARIASSALVLAGNAKDERGGAAVAAAAAADDRIVRIDRFVPFERVRELYEAADAAVVTRGDGGTSGSLILALSLDTPVIVADMPANRRLVGDGSAGWLFRPGNAGDLRSALEAAAGDESARAERASAAHHAASVLDWHEAAVRFASLLPEIPSARRRPRPR